MTQSLEDLFDDLRDIEVSEPSAIDKVLSYVEVLQEESELFIQILVEKLEQASVTWSQPWYQERSFLTRPLKEEANSYEDKYKTGTMTKDEIDHISKNWRKFIKKFKVPDKLNRLATWKNRVYNNKSPEEKARHFVVSFLARGLQRTLFQVYRHIVSHYGAPNKGIYSKDEENLMNICFHHCPKKAVRLLSLVLGRDPRGIYKRLHIATNGKPAKQRLRWNLELSSKFLHLLMKYTGENLEGLKYKKIHVKVWRKVAKRFGHPYEFLHRFWNTTLHCQLFIKCRVTLKRLRIKFFKILRSSPYKVWPDIRWKEVQDKFPDGFTWKMLYWTTIRWFTNYKNYRKVPLQKLVEYGLQVTRSQPPYARQNKRLKTLVLNSDGSLKVKYYDDKLRVTYF